MRAKRSKQYRKLIERFERQFGFREPYQVLVDSLLVQDAARFKMDIQPALERTLHGKVKVMISQCSMRHLYARGREEGGGAVIQLAKAFERRRCGHRPEDFPEPLPELECLAQCVTGKVERKVDEESEAEDDGEEKKAGKKKKGKRGSGAGGEERNKNCYAVASQDADIRRRLRRVPGTPLIYIARSVMIMEPVSDSSSAVLSQTERGKFTDEITKLTGKKRKRDPDADNGEGSEPERDDDDAGAEDGRPERKAKKRSYGPKGPNPLSIKKKKTPAKDGDGSAKKSDRNGEPAPKKKRMRKSKAKAVDGEQNTGGEVPVITPVDTEA